MRKRGLSRVWAKMAMTCLEGVGCVQTISESEACAMLAIGNAESGRRGLSE